MTILSLGSVNCDLQVRVERWPGPGETLPVRDFVAVGGGKAANVALLARRLGEHAVLLGRTGEDAFARIAREPLENAGVDLRHARSSRAERTGVALIAVRPDGEKTILLAGNANDHWSEDDMAAAQASVAEAPERSVLVADLEVPGEVVRRLAGAARERGFKTVLDPSPVRAMREALYPHFDCITPNPGEAAALAGFSVTNEDDALRAGTRLREQGAPAALVKLSDGGCVIVGDGRPLCLSAPQVEVVDKTGAGDAFAGALAVGLLRGKSVAEAARLAVAASAAAVSGYGSQASYLEEPELENLLSAVKERSWQQ